MNHSLIAEVAAKIAGLGLAAVVTATLLGGVSGMADRQYRDAALAQASSPAAPPVVVARSEQPRI